MDKRNKYYWLLVVLLLGGCSVIGAIQFEDLYGKVAVRQRTVDVLPPGAIDYWREVKPILERRCVVCHGCYDAPCQLKMSSIEGIDRGASKAKVYHSTRLQAEPTTRLFKDAHTTGEWREKGFYSVLNERAETVEANREAGLMYRMLALKEQNPLPKVKQLGASFDLSLKREQSCVKDENFNQFAREHPLWGMPYALPGLAQAEQDVIKQWLEQGALYTARPPLLPSTIERIQYWEAFLNGDALKQQLSSRYLYEHLYFAHLYFPDLFPGLLPNLLPGLERRQFFTLVRSATPPGEPVQLIATRRPYDDPGVERVYYRIQPVLSTIVTKTHMPYRLDEQRMQRWQTLFVDAPFEVSQLPSYEVQYASNPFVTFDEIPVHSRYQFLLDEAQFTIMAFIKGTVCRGQIALSVIQDNFWVFFVQPDPERLEVFEDFMAQREESLELPASSGDIFRPLKHWKTYKNQQQKFMEDQGQYLADHLAADDISLNLIWDGDGRNNNAALTIFRHVDSATVEKGLIGQVPKTAWVLDYGLLERIHYLLVAGYDVFGNGGHQLFTRLYMDFLRMEAEAKFLQLLPPVARAREREFWYQGVDADEIKRYLTLPAFEKKSVPAIAYQSGDEKRELFGMLAQRLNKVLPTKHQMSSLRSAATRGQLARLLTLKGKAVTFMPEIAFVKIESNEGDEYLTLVANRAYSSMTSMIKEQKNRLPDEDTLSVVPGFIGAYPNAFYQLEEAQLANFVDAISGIETESDYGQLLDAYGVRRTDADFWVKSDAFHRAYRQRYPLSSGVLDFNRLDNR
ncbi:MAG: fatty acid cis/trans isomerase [Gammaproteobacteria bacterium]|nr:fatty acid cis/trans isomerase [Gammaproteobacteria bacterium]MBQ0841171.1 fatty acid cis/trans isomerase [Gammaproteobacteria bacterium]